MLAEPEKLEFNSIQPQPVIASYNMKNIVKLYADINEFIENYQKKLADQMNDIKDELVEVTEKLRKATDDSEKNELEIEKEEIKKKQNQCQQSELFISNITCF